jgi:GNAT superfamily N-acetyltransferase
VVIRPIRGSDKPLLRAAFARLSPESRYRRFLAPTPLLTERMVRYLTEIDHHDHEALVALDADTGIGVGVARFVRLPDRKDVAEAAVTVTDDWHGRGLGTVLLELLGVRARDEGIARFTATVLSQNREIFEVLEALGPVTVIQHSGGTTEIEVDVPQDGLTDELRALLRHSGSNRFPVVPPPPLRR